MRIELNFSSSRSRVGKSSTLNLTYNKKPYNIVQRHQALTNVKINTLTLPNSKNRTDHRTKERL